MQTHRLPPHEVSSRMTVPHREIYHWKEGTFIENIAVDGKGDIYVSDYPGGIVYKIVAGVATTHCQLPSKIAGLAFDTEENLYVTGGETGVPPGIVFRIKPDGHFEKWVQLPEASFLNGITPLSPTSLLAVDSLNGNIYRIDTGYNKAELWLHDDHFLPDPGLPGFPGINGIKRFGAAIYVSNTAYGKIYRIQLDKMERPGEVTLLAKDLCCDDLALDASGNLYLASHMHNSLVRLTPTGEKATLAGPEEGMVGSTACAFGRTKGDTETLYVVTEGGIAVPYNSVIQKAKMVALEIGKPGAALL